MFETALRFTTQFACGFDAAHVSIFGVPMVQDRWCRQCVFKCTNLKSEQRVVTLHYEFLPVSILFHDVVPFSPFAPRCELETMLVSSCFDFRCELFESSMPFFSLLRVCFAICVLSLVSHDSLCQLVSYYPPLECMHLIRWSDAMPPFPLDSRTIAFCVRFDIWLHKVFSRLGLRKF